MNPFKLSIMPMPEGETDSFDFYSLPGDDPNEFHVICTTSMMSLISLLVQVEGATITMKEEWRREAKSRSWHVVADVLTATSEASFFTAREDGHFHAYKIDGTPSWSHDFAATVSEFNIYPDPFTGERMMVVPSLDKTLRLLTASNGRLAWGDTFQSGVNVADQRLLSGGERHLIVAGGNDYTLRCYARNKNDKVGAYKMIWFHKFESYVRDVSISPDGHVAAVADDGFLKVLDASTGKVLWKHEHNSFAWKCKILPAAGMVVSTSYQLPLAMDESGQKLGNPGVVTCHTLADGKLVWGTKPEDGVNVSALNILRYANRDYLLAGTTGGDIMVLDINSGDLVQKCSVPHVVNHVGSFLLAGGRLAIIGCQECENGSLFAGLTLE